GLFTGNTKNSYIKMVYSLKNTTIGDWIVGKGSEVENQVTAYIPVDVAFDMNQVVNYVINFGTGNGGYDDGGNPIIDSKDMIQFDTKLTDWDAETPIDPTPTPPAAPQMSFGIETTAANQSYCLPFGTSGVTGEYELTVDWGDDSEITPIPAGTPLDGGIAHTYAVAKEYTITITSSERDYEKAQMPKVSWEEDKLLKSIDTPLLNTAETDYTLTFNGCTNLVSLSDYLFKYNTAVTKFWGVFTDCPNLKSIPANLFEYNTIATDFERVFFSCPNLSSIPANLFEHNTIATNFTSAFMYCTTLDSIPAELFKHNTIATDFAEVFSKCTDLDSIPAELFKNNTIANNFTSAFEDCTSLSSIPAELFKNNTIATNFFWTFKGCTNLSAIPAELFKSNTLATNFQRTFYGCSKAKVNANIFCNEAMEKTTRFNLLTEKINFEEAFYGVGKGLSDMEAYKSTFPTLWNYAYSGAGVSGTDCFTDAKASNAVDVIPAWGGAIVPAEKPKMSFDIETKAANSNYPLPFAYEGTTGEYELTIDWGDNSVIQSIPAGTYWDEYINHTYAVAGTYTITITSTETDYKKVQIPEISWQQDKMVISVNTPLLYTAVMNFGFLFEGCSSLSSLPAELFKYNAAANNFNKTFKDCSSLKSVPDDLFAYNTGAITLTHVFERCSSLESISDDLFKSNTEITDFTAAFFECSNLGSIPDFLFANNKKATIFSYTFSGCSNLTAIPAELFKSNTIATDFTGTFRGCKNLGTIEPELFKDNTIATNFSNTFSNCSNLGTIPPDLFKHNTIATNFSSTFSKCSNLGSIPPGLFKDNTIANNFESVFSECSKAKVNSNIFCDEATEKNTRFNSLTERINFFCAFEAVGKDLSTDDIALSTFPALWEYTYSSGVNSSYCFVRANASNSSAVTEEWKTSMYTYP
ncbi:MAG: hypothetical protein ACRCZY_07010, partial [Phocaeicola sp.]